MQEKRTLTVYACGGTGVNIGRLIEEQCCKATDDDTPVTDVIVYYIDTSKSNTKHVKTDNVYLFDQLDGSGSDRTRNKDVISDYVPDILLEMPPKDISVVIHSTSGGSGSVIGPIITSRLLKDKKPVITAAVLSSSTLIQLKNTIKVLSSFESIAKARQRVLPVLLCNNNGSTETEVNSTVVNAVHMLSILYSGKLDRLDSADLDNWINYNNITSNEVGAVMLDFTTDKITLNKNNFVCSVATITNDINAVTAFQPPIENQSIGIINSNNSRLKGQIHCVLIDGAIQEAYKGHVAGETDFNKFISSRPTRVSISNDRIDNDDGVDY